MPDVDEDEGAKNKDAVMEDEVDISDDRVSNAL